jgi:hypothetical protein
LPLIVLVLVSLGALAAPPTRPTNLHDVPSDLTVPPAAAGDPAPGKRVTQRNPDRDGWDLHHVLYLPPDWKPGGKYPVIVEYPGNGGYKNALGDRCTGRPDDCHLGYGISGGKGMIWVCLPFVDPVARKHALTWWGDPDATAAYCKQTVARVCKEYGGDPGAVILAGFSRGAIACNYIGLRDDEIAKLWLAFVPHSHYDGVRKWPYPDGDAASARARLKRLKGRPQFVSHEQSVEETRAFLKDGPGAGGVTFLSIPYPNHSDEWVLKDIPERKQLRDWLAGVLRAAGGGGEG